MSLADDEGTTVLVVDDETSILDLLRHSLEPEYRVLVAQSGTEALELIDQSVDVVVLDRRMPVLSGGDVLEEIRHRGFDVPVAMLTAVRPGIDILDQGFDDYLLKPVSMRKVHACIDRLLTLGRYDDVVREYYAVTAKVSALESSLSATVLHGDDQYAALVDQQSKLEEDAHTHLQDVSEISLEQLLHDRTAPIR